MYNFVVPTILKSKPTGNVGKGGNLYQNTAEYTQFKRESIYHLKHQKEDYNLSDPLKSCKGLAIIGFLKKPKGRAKDLGQLSGAIYDILTTAKIWKDDNLRVFDRSVSYYFWDEYIQGYHLRICQNEADWRSIMLCDTNHLKVRSKEIIEGYTELDVFYDI